MGSFKFIPGTLMGLGYCDQAGEAGLRGCVLPGASGCPQPGCSVKVITVSWVRVSVGGQGQHLFLVGGQ